MTQVFGEFSEDFPLSQEGLTIAFSPISLPLKQRWQTNGLSADFMADYFAVFFPGNNPTATESDTAEVKSAVSFIANELIENAMKFNHEHSSHPISISLQLHKDRLVFRATNSVDPSTLDSFQDYIHQLTTSDPQEMYLQLMEADTPDPRIILVTTMVQLMI
jgi:hypothetical protein